MADVGVVQVVEGQEAARLVGAWVSSAYLDRLRVEVSLVLVPCLRLQ